MKCFTVTKGDPGRFKVLAVIKRHGWKPTFVCDTDAQRNSLIKLGVQRASIHLCGSRSNLVMQGVSRARDFVCTHLMPKNEWCVWIDDNVRTITGLPRDYTRDKLNLSLGHNWRALFETELSRAEVQAYFQDTIRIAEQRGTIYCGFSNERNFFFRARRWQFWGQCRTQLALYKNDGSCWMPFATMMMEDWYKSIDVVARYGSVVINRHLKPVKEMFEAGGIGSFKERLPWLRENCRKLASLYSGLIKCKTGGSQYGTEASGYDLTFAKRSQATVDQWRRQAGYLPAQQKAPSRLPGAFRAEG